MSATGHIDIKSRTGQLLCSPLITPEAERVEELMQSDYVELSWKDAVSTPLPPGAYIEVDNERYRLLDSYTPDQASDAYTYTPQFHSRVAAWNKVPFFFYTFNASNEVIAREPEWTLTDTPANFMAQIIRAIKIETGEIWTYAVDSSLNGTQSIHFGATDIFSSLNSIAGIFNTEWRADKTTNTLYLGKAMHGTAVTLSVDANIQTPSVTKNLAGYYNRFYVFGSTRNVTQDYQGANVNNLVNKRLTLDPVKYPGGYIDIEDNLQPSQVMQKILLFDDVYPRAQLKLPDNGLRARLMYRLDESTGNPKVVGTTSTGQPIYDQYVIWYIRPVVSDTGLELTFNDSTYDPVSCPTGMLIKGKALSVHFNSGALTGREFELAYHTTSETLKNSDGTPFEVYAGDFEILFKEEEGLVLPTGPEAGIAPQAGDKLTLFNCRMPAEYTASAYTELEELAQVEISERYSADTNNYQFESNPKAFQSADYNLQIGSAVHYVNGEYSYDTRIIKIVRKLDLPYEQTITVGNDRIKKSSETIKEEVTNANRNIDVLAALNNLTKNIQDGYNRAQQAMIEGFNRISRMWQIDPDHPDAIFSTYNVYSQKAVSTLGLNDDTGGGNTGGNAYDLLESWSDYDATHAHDALSAALGYDLLTRVIKLENSEGSEISEISVSVTGTGNAITAISNNGPTINAVKGENFALADHVHSGYVPFSVLNNFYSSSECDNKFALIGHTHSQYLLASAYTAQDVLSKLKTVDGHTSGLDADTLDGYHGADYLRSFWSYNPGYDCSTHNDSSLASFTYANNAPFTGAVVDISVNGYGFYLGTAVYSDNALYYRRHGAAANDGGMGGWQQLARVTDNVASASKLAAGSKFIEWDAANGAWRVDGDLYATGSLTALGFEELSASEAIVESLTVGTYGQMQATEDALGIWHNNGGEVRFGSTARFTSGFFLGDPESPYCIDETGVAYLSAVEAVQVTVGNATFTQSGSEIYVTIGTTRYKLTKTKA